MRGVNERDGMRLWRELNFTRDLLVACYCRLVKNRFLEASLFFREKLYLEDEMSLIGNVKVLD